MNEITLKGTPIQMGSSLGKMMKKTGYSPPPVPKSRHELAMGCEKALRKYTPSLLEEIDAMVKAGGYENTSLKAFEVSLLPYPDYSCSIFAVSGDYTENGNVIFARNYDWETKFQEFSTIFRAYPTDGLSSLSCTDLLVGRYGGINEAGLAIGLTAIPGCTEDHPGVMLHLATRWVLDNCKDVAEAVDFLERIPHVRGNNYLVADSSGSIALIQASPKRVEVNEADNGIAITTNHFLSDEMQAYEDESRIPESSVPRLKLIDEWFRGREETIAIEEAQKILKGRFDEKKGVYQDFTRNDVPFSTIWSWTYESGKNSLQIAHGFSYSSEFKEYSF
ncbi:MAG: C45 family peptidase [Candidatus Thorarchaeota archaeon]